MFGRILELYILNISCKNNYEIIKNDWYLYKSVSPAKYLFE